MDTSGLRPGHPSVVPLQDRIREAIADAQDSESPLLAFFNAWDNLVDDYALFVEGLKHALENVLREEGIQATISGRVKSHESIQKSVRRREALGENFQNIEAVFGSIHDLAGFRIVVDYPSGMQKTQDIVQRFDKIALSEFRSNRDLGLEWKPIFGAFESKNYRVKIWPQESHPLYRFRGVLIEIQVFSIAESLYNRLSHPLIYKKPSGQLSVNDQKIIDISHGLSLCYWICLSCMESQLENDSGANTPEIPDAVRRVASDEEVELSELIEKTPTFNSPIGGIRTIDLLNFITANKAQEVHSSSDLHENLRRLASISTQTTNYHSGAGHIITNNATTTNNFGSTTSNHAPITNHFHSESSHTSDIFVKALFIRDPRVDNDDIQVRKGGLHPKSCDWIIENTTFKRWASEHSHSILWINGDPGKGKTMLICRLINELSPITKLQDKGSSTILSYFFCDANNSDQNDAISVLRGMIYLLIKQDHEAVECFRAELQKFDPVYFETKPLTFSQLRSIFLQIVKSLASKRIYLIIDALDECIEGQQQNKGLQALLRLITEDALLPHVKWIVSSRNKPLIARFLQKYSTNINLEQNEASISEAVTEYVKHKVQVLFENETYDKEETQDVESLLLSKAQSTFLWVALACQMLENDGTYDPIGVLHKFPTGLDSLYGLMLKEVQSEERYQQIISIMLTVFRPVSLQELGLLISNFQGKVSDERMRKVVGSCGSFLSVRNDFVHFVHESAKEFLSNPTYNAHYDAPAQHYNILRTSFNIMSKFLKRDMFRSENSVERASASLLYPCTKWASHLQKCKDEALVHELGDGSHLDKFLRTNYLDWILALGYMGVTSDGILAMYELSRELVGHISEFANLARIEAWFLRHHKTAIEESPPSIYAALVFIPPGNILRKAYHREVPTWATLKPDAETWWDNASQTMNGYSVHSGNMSFSYDSRLLSASSGSTVSVWDTITGELIHDLDGHDGMVWSVSFSGSNYRVASASPYMIQIWDGEKGERINALEFDHGHQVPAISAVLSNKGDVVACAFSDRTIKLWDIGTWSQIRTIQDPVGYSSFPFEPEHFEVSQCGHFLWSYDSRGVPMWNKEDCGNPQRIQLDYNDSGYPFKFSSKCQLLVLDRSQVRSWDLHTMKFDKSGISEIVPCNTETFGSCKQPPATFHVSPTTGLVDKIWDWLEKHDTLFPFIFLPRSLVFSPTGNLLALNSDGKTEILDLTIRDATSPHWGEKRQSRFDFRSNPRIWFSPNGNFILFKPNGNDVENAFWNIETGKVEHASSFHFHDVESLINYLHISPSSRMMAYVQSSGISVTKMRMHASSQQVECKIQLASYTSALLLAFSPDDQWLAWADLNDVYAFDIEERTEVQLSDYLTMDIEGGFLPPQLAFSHDSRYLACLLPNNILIWNVKSWEIESILSIPGSSDGGKAGLAFSDEDSYLVVSQSGHFRNQPTKIIILDWLGKHDSQIFELDTQCVVRSFSLELSQVDTSTGTFQLTQDGICRQGYGLSRDQQWIMWGINHVLWLPPELRPAEWRRGLCYSVYNGNKIAIRTEFGPVIYLEFNPAGPEPKWYL
ncbi:hypothetical protein DER45DRAFT_580374 [Fusarium avenaceum]|nr:hypothetical protein DER45DRAFT_580374 [Fusarium avenaceum]